MHAGIKHLHHYSAYLVLILLFITVVIALVKLASRQPHGALRKLSAVTMGVTHLQFVFGLILYFISPLGIANFSGENMKISTARLYMLEHPLVMLIAVILLTIGSAKAKKATTEFKKNKMIFFFFLVGLILVLSRLPQSFWSFI